MERLRRAREEWRVQMGVQKDSFLPNTQVIFSSDTIYFNIHINIYEQKNI